MWNKGQCRRVANLYRGIADMLKNLDPDRNSGSVVDEASDGGSRIIQEIVASCRQLFQATWANLEHSPM